MTALSFEGSTAISDSAISDTAISDMAGGVILHAASDNRHRDPAPGSKFPTRSRFRSCTRRNCALTLPLSPS